MTIRVKVLPRAVKTQLAGTLADGTLKIQVAAPADKGKANAELIAFLAQHFQVPVAGIKILSGLTSTRKLIRLRESG